MTICMTDAETAAHIRKWCESAQLHFSWPTDGCGYEQHMRFVRHRNLYWNTDFTGTFREFILAYADKLEDKP